ncbi:MAG TPA: hypothetical protein EYN07_00740 [Flavobacteriaceae bacterium]|jgi:hypothetical protein|nr:hypothetical protein [Flavobacteriaceae bacterium]HIN97742.1 hypothetical protein [Flavobacteriaceae bacterium]|tara:strand:+ start:1822 stop:2601 length:780 start_codon:yes stop_codon:yes gene_type:complete
MITFFRKVRQRLLIENRFSKYLLYAIGEIILVVIGILIALQINNWNEARKNNMTESDYYCRLLEDFELDRQNIKRLSDESDYKISKSKELLLELPKKEKSKGYLIDNYIQALRTNAFVPSKVTILDITSSGKLNLIKNDSLKQILIRYYAELDNLIYQLDLNRNHSIERAFAYEDDNQVGFQYADYAKASLGEEIIATLPEDNWHLNENSKVYKQFQNDLVFFVLMSNRELQHFENILKEMQPVYNQLTKLCSKDDKTL